MLELELETRNEKQQVSEYMTTSKPHVLDFSQVGAGDVAMFVWLCVCVDDHDGQRARAV